MRVARVREQAAFPCQRRVKPGQQLVQRPAKGFDLVPSVRHGQSLGHVVLGDLLGALAHAFDGPQRSSGDLVTGVACEQERERADQQQ